MKILFPRDGISYRGTVPKKGTVIFESDPLHSGALLAGGCILAKSDTPVTIPKEDKTEPIEPIPAAPKKKAAKSKFKK